MKRVIPVLLVLAICLVFTPAVLAQTALRCGPGDGRGDGSQFACVGTVSAAPVADGNGGGAMQVTVDRGWPNLDGTQLSVTVADDAQLFTVADCQRTAADFAALVQGAKVNLRGSIDTRTDTPVYTAERVCVSQPRFSCGGTVQQVDAANDLLYVTVTKGSSGLPANPVAVTITSDTEIFQAGDGARCGARFCDDDAIQLSDVLVGEHVQVSGVVDASSGTAVYDAACVCVSQPRFFCEGAVSGVDATNNVLTIDVSHGSGGLSGSLQLAVTSDTRLFSFADFACDQLDLSQVAVGDQVAVMGTMDVSWAPRSTTRAWSSTAATWRCRLPPASRARNRSRRAPRSRGGVSSST